MLDKVVLCKEGQEIYTGLKDHSYSLQESSVKVYLVSGSISESDLSTVTWNTLNGLEKTELVSKHSMLTELHVVAYGVAGGTTKGHHIALVIGGSTCLAIAYSQEEMTGNEKLFLTFDFEETKGVLTAKADFDGNITQGILDEIISTVAKTGSYNDLSNKPAIPAAANNSTITVYAGGTVLDNSISGGTELGSFTVDQSSNGFVNLGAAAAKAVDTSISASVSSSNLPTTDAVKGYVKDSTFSFKKHSDDAEAFASFSTNASSGNTFVLGYGAAADKGVDTSIGSQSSDNLPTSDAVKSYVSNQGFATTGQLPTVNNSSVTIKKNDSDTSNPFSFTLNQSSNAELNLGLGTAAFKSVDSSITDGSTQNDVPTSDAVKSYISGKSFASSSDIKDSTITVRRNSSHANPPTFTLNQASNDTVDLGLGAAAEKGVDTEIGSSSSSNLPTSDAVKSYVSNQGFALASNVPSIAGLASDSVVPKYASYDSTNKTIYFKHDSSDTDASALFSLDATAFIKDGMVSNVEISNGNLVVSFNTDAGKQPISIPLTDIFNPNNYYTSSQTDTAISNAITALSLGGAAQKGVDTSIGTASSDNLPTSDAVKTYVSGQIPTVGNGELKIKKHTTDSTPISSGFTANSSSDQTVDLALGAAADMDVDKSSSAGSGLSTNSDTSVPTSKAVAEYITGQGFLTASNAGINNSTVTFYRNSSSDSQSLGSFTLNQSSNSNIEFGFGNIVTKNFASSVTASTGNGDIPTLGLVSTLISNGVHDGTLTIQKNSVTLDTFSANSLNNKTINIVLGAAADKSVDSTITVTDAGTAQATAGDNLPTSEAVRTFVEGKGYLTSVSNETIALAYNNPALGANQTSEFGVFTLNGSANRIVFGSAAHAEVVYLSGTETIDTVQNQDTHLISLGQAKTLVSNATELKTVSPSDAPASGSQNGITVPVGAMVWLALNFSGSVGIMDFTTVSSNADGTPILSGNGTNAQVVAYMAQIRDNAGDFYALEDQMLAAGQKFRTTNCMDSSGMAVPSYGFALCVRLPDDSSNTNG